MTDTPSSVSEGSITALRKSSERLRFVVEPMDDQQLVRQAYPQLWTIADVLSHIGSGSIIMRERFERSLAGDALPDDFAPGVWDEWNAKSPRAKADDAVAADLSLLNRLAATTSEQRSSLHFPLGPLDLDFGGFVGLRLNEHVLHTWDVAVVDDPAAALPPDATEIVIDNLELIARFTGKPTGHELTIVIATTAPGRQFLVTLTPETVAMSVGDGTAPSDLVVPAEAFVRLVYGRLDAQHTPEFEGDASLLDELRRVFPGP